MTDVADIQPWGGYMSKAISCMMLAGSFALLSACDRKSQPTTEARTVKSGETASPDSEMAKKLAEAKAAYAKLTPAEKARIAAQMKKVQDTLPMSLAEARSMKVRPVGKPEITLAATAPTGTPTVIAAWASWCIPCKKEAGELARLRQQYARDKLNIVYLNIGTPEVERVKGPAFLREAGAEQLGLTMLHAADFLKLTRVDQLSVPRILVFDRSGRPTKVISGAAVAGGRDPRLDDAVKKVVG
ncbi:TlpA disulfide reductase family protein [Sphingomonas sp. S2-65]|uniref:TlpA disulfide reductase family protein n=1 Tax=Sphingomonas sp. S2-65 TaxID=2903960 RepID=UPI001F3C6536|nr:TlpA disulfide reductase family protein [Sphingomonas sp. S2-65]UYY57237.1 TlpA family protein disulfide reductase [Sphingomonas sp. S2-65]